MNRPTNMILCWTLCICCAAPTAAMARMTRGETGGSQAGRSLDRQEFRQERLGDRQQLRVDMLENLQEIGDATRDRLREHQAERLQDSGDFLQERRQDRQQLRVDVID